MRNYFKLSRSCFASRKKGEGPIALEFFDDRDLSDIRDAYERLVGEVVGELRRETSRADLIVSVWRRPDWEGPWESVPTVGAFGFGGIVDEGRAA